MTLLYDEYNEDGSQKEGSMNILLGKGENETNTYGKITGGRVIVKVGDETRLLSGSVNDIEKQFN